MTTSTCSLYTHYSSSVSFTPYISIATILLGFCMFFLRQSSSSYNVLPLSSSIRLSLPHVFPHAFLVALETPEDMNTKAFPPFLPLKLEKQEELNRALPLGICLWNGSPILLKLKFKAWTVCNNFICLGRKILQSEERERQQFVVKVV